MTKILGLDLGTNSIGWAVVGENKRFQQNSIFPLEDKGVHIFSEGVKIEKGVESSKAAERRQFRSARRLKFRRKLRKYETLKVLIKNGMCPLSLDELEKWRSLKDTSTGKTQTFKNYPQSKEFLNWLRTDNERNPYHFRAKAAKNKLPPMQLGRAFYHLAQRRGFLSNRLEQNDEAAYEELRNQIFEILESENEIRSLQSALEDLFPDADSEEKEDEQIEKLQRAIFKNFNKKKSPKDYNEIKQNIEAILNRKENLGKVSQGIKDLNDEIKESGFDTLGQYFYKLYKDNLKEGKDKINIRRRYTAREDHYLREFKYICKVQELNKEITTQLEKAIFYQRPLKSQKGLVGKCSFEKDKPRSPISHPAFEEFRALQFINNIKYKNENGEWITLDIEQRKLIWNLFLRKSKPSFDFTEIREKLSPRNTQLDFNYSDRTNVSGCPTIAQLKNVFGEDWQNEVYQHYKLKTFRKKQGTKSKEEVIHDVWHVLFTFNKQEKLKDFAIRNLHCAQKTADKFSKIKLKRDYASLSLKAIQNILHYLREGLIFTYAVFLANINKVVGDKIWNDPKNQKIIRNELSSIIENYREEKRKISIVNDLISHFKNKNNNSNKSYLLSDKDKKEIVEKIKDSYGSVTFGGFGKDKQNEIIAWIEEHYQKQLREGKNGEFIKPKRLDEIFADFLIANFNATAEQLDKLYHPSDIEVYKQPERSEDGKLYLGSPIIPSIKNPMAMRTLHQLRKLVNTLIREGTIDEETRIHIELARDLNDANQRKVIQRFQRDREKENNVIRGIIAELFKETKNVSNYLPQDDDLTKVKLWTEQIQDNVDLFNLVKNEKDPITKYKLWKEQEGICIYTGKQIPLHKLFDGISFDIEHTLPRSISNDNSLENKTVSDAVFNRQEKGNKIPTELSNYSEILPRIKKWELEAERYEILFNSRKKAKGLETKEQKDKRIQEKHYYKMYLDYWKGKYKRFTMKEVPKGFKNSQIVDTGIITKYSRAYLKSVFPSVYAVKGSMVSEFRKIWGLQSEYEKKERTNHIHHCIDAVTIACMTKEKYDVLANAWTQEERYKKEEAKNILRNSKPWDTFTQDLNDIENEIFVSHHSPDNVHKQTKKKLRIRGNIQYTEDGNPMYEQGDTVRGSLHKETFYGAIRRKDEDSNEKIFYVLRKELTKLEETDIKNIVDKAVKEKIEKAVAEKGFKKAVAEPIWMNEEKKIQIKKVRCFAPSVKNPLDIKAHRDKSKYEHKQNYHTVNDENYGMAIYEGTDETGEIKRNFELINMYDAAEYFKLSNSNHRKEHPIVPPTKDGLPLKTVIKKGMMILLYDKSPNEIWDLEESERQQRFYEIVQLDTESSGIKLMYHQEARIRPEVTKHMGLKTGQKGGKNIGKYKAFPYIKISVKQFDALIQGVDFIISSTGKIQKIVTPK